MRVKGETRRQFRNYRDRVTVWARWGVTPADTLDGAEGVERVMLVGAPPRTITRWAAGGLPPGWGHDPRGHYLHGHAPVLRYRNPRGRTVELVGAGAWFGDVADVTPEDASAAWDALGVAIESVFRRGRLLSSPSATGRSLWVENLPDGAAYPVLSDGVQDLIRETAGQGRIELYPDRDSAPDALPALYGYDARWSYAALCWGLPSGVPTWDHRDEWAGYLPARYRVRVTVPGGWIGPGLLGVRADNGAWEWPREPGRTFTTWVDGAELHVARNAGWRATITARLVWPKVKTGPLDTWSRKLVALRADLAGDPLCAAAVRSILLHALGGFWGAEHRVTHATEDAASVPATAGASLTMDGDTFLWSEGTGQRWTDAAHPEWTAAVWGRARARLLDAPTGRKTRAGMLHLPAGTVVAVRTDAIYMTTDPRWPDDGKPGRFRRQLAIPHEVTAPRTHADLLQLRGTHG